MTGFGTSDRLTAQAVMTTFNTTNTVPPEVVVAAWGRSQKLGAAVRNLGPGGEQALYCAVADAIEADVAPSTNPEVQRVITASALSNEGVMRGVDALAMSRFVDACTQHADRIVGIWRKPFDKAAQDLTAAQKRIGNVPLENTEIILGMGDDIASVWAVAVDAVKLIDQIVNGWEALGTLTRTVTRSPNHRALRTSPIDARTWLRLELHNRKLGPWEALNAGLTLDLPTAAEFRARFDKLQQQLTFERERQAQVAADRATGRNPGLASLLGRGGTR